MPGMRVPQSLSGRLLVATTAMVVAGAVAWLIVGSQTASRSAATTKDAAASGHGWLRDADGSLPNVVLLTVDTLRADHVSGTALPEWHLTPAIERFAERGTLFLAARSTAPATRPALAALMTGSYLHRHGVGSNFGAIGATPPVLAGVLQRSGYATAGIYGNKILDAKSGLQRGFDTYLSFVGTKDGAHDEVGVDLALKWVASQAREPWFLWLHLMNPHGPYNSSPPAHAAAEAPDLLADVALEPSTSNYGLGPIIPRYQRMNIPARAAEYRRRYRDEVVFVDAQIDRFLEGLALLGHGSALVVFTADHGESLGENDYFFQHGWLANEASLRIPMLWSKPGTIEENHRSPATVSLVDVMPTLLAGLGIKSPPVDGTDLSAALRGRGELADGVVFALSGYPNEVTTAVRGRWKLVHTPAPPNPLPGDHWRAFYATAESWVLHDLEAEPGESVDAAARQPQVFAELRERLQAWERVNGLPSGSRALQRVDGEAAERLRSLGYAD